MAQILDSFPATTRRSKYPYDEWFDGKVRRLIFNEDFTATPESMRSLLYAQAKKRGTQIKLTIDGDDVIVQAFPKPDSYPHAGATGFTTPYDDQPTTVFPTPPMS